MRRTRCAPRSFAARSGTPLVVTAVHRASVGAAAVHGAPVTAAGIGIDPVARRRRGRTAFIGPAFGAATILSATLRHAPSAEPQLGLSTVVHASIRRLAPFRLLHVHGRAPGQTTP